MLAGLSATGLGPNGAHVSQADIYDGIDGH